LTRYVGSLITLYYGANICLKAKSVISRLLDKPLDDDEVVGQLQEILSAIEAESNEDEPSWGEVFSNATKTRNLHRVVLGMGPYMVRLSMHEMYVSYN
jgi:hypothetical protein